MKKLSIEQKAQRYDEAIKKAKSKIIGDKNHILYEDDVIEMFPELIENEDDKIRKELIDYFSGPHATYTFRGIPWDRLVAYLEKQGNKDEEILVLKDQIESLNAAIKALKEAHKIEFEKQ